MIHHKAHCHNVRVPLPLLSCAVQAGRYDLDESALRAHNFEMHEVAARPQLEPDTKQGMVINCATYQGGRRVADIDLDQHARHGRFVWIGLHEPDQTLRPTVQQRFGWLLAIEETLRARQANFYPLCDTAMITMRA